MDRQGGVPIEGLTERSGGEAYAARVLEGADFGWRNPSLSKSAPVPRKPAHEPAVAASQLLIFPLMEAAA